MGLVMDGEVSAAFTEINKKLEGISESLNGFIVKQTECNGVFDKKIGILEQRLNNGDRQDDRDIKKKTLKFSYDRLVVTVIVGGFGIWQIVKELIQ
jgi:hypothetical protein